MQHLLMMHQLINILKCWNNRAYEEDVPNEPNVVIPAIKRNNYWIAEKGTKTIEIFVEDEDSENDYSTKENSLASEWN